MPAVVAPSRSLRVGWPGRRTRAFSLPFLQEFDSPTQFIQLPFALYQRIWIADVDGESQAFHLARHSGRALGVEVGHGNAPAPFLHQAAASGADAVAATEYHAYLRRPVILHPVLPSFLSVWPVTMGLVRAAFATMRLRSSQAVFSLSLDTGFPGEADPKLQIIGDALTKG